MKTISRVVLVMVGIVLAGLSACQQEEKMTFEGIQTQAALFAQATLTKAAVQTEMVAALSPVAPTASAVLPTEAPPSPTEVPSQTSAPSATATGIPTVGVTYVVQSPTAPPPQATRLSFASGATNISVDGSLSYGGSRAYVFWAAKDQLIDVSVSSAQDVLLAVSNAKGQRLLSAGAGRDAYRGYLPADGDWYLEVIADPDAADFSLYLGIPQRLSFPPNAIGMTASGIVRGGQSFNYLAWAAKGQTLKVSVSPADKLALVIYHVDGDVLLSMMNPTSSFEGVLPKSGDYFINVHAIPGSGTISFSMPLTIK